MEDWSSLISALSAVAVAIIAFAGLNTWRRQLRGKFRI
jgi:hypothetical protein